MYLKRVSLLLSLMAWACSSPKGSSQVRLASEVKWEKLNPARGNKSPKAATLWGDRNAKGPTGFLVKFIDGFSSPPHIHNVSYRGVVIEGQIFNNDAGAAKMWMPMGSYWTQPRGQAHITAAQGKTNIAFISIEDGPYLVKPVSEAFEGRERAINVHYSNIVWLQASGTASLVATEITQNKSTSIAFLWGQPQAGILFGTMLKLPGGFAGIIKSEASVFNAVVISGLLNYKALNGQAKQLEPGSFFSSKSSALHNISTGSETLIYIRTNNHYVLD